MTLIRETDKYVITNEELDLEVSGLLEDQEKFQVQIKN